MKFAAVKNTMLYCPKCQQTYEDGVQRFCLNDGGRLLPAPSSGKSASQSGGVFTNVINRKNNEDDEFANAPRFSEMAFRPPPGKVFKSEPKSEIAPPFKPLNADEPELELELEPAPPFNPPSKIKSSSEPDFELELEPSETKPPRVINPNEIASGQALLGDRKINPAGRLAVTLENPEVLLNQTVKGRYHITEQIGADEGAIDYLAEDKIVAGKKVVVRVLTDEDTDDSFSNKIFAEERVSLSHVSHPNIVSVIDSGELLEGKPFVITEYVEGESVKSRLQRKGKFDSMRTARIIRQASYALSEVHQSGILHRNLKPENIILTVNETGAEQVKLTNFGASKGKLNEKNLPYKSPEQVEGKLANFASDEFALAVIAYQMLTDRLPFNATRIGGLLKEQREGLIIQATTLHDSLPPSADKILGKALAFNPAERYPKVRDFGDALYNAVTAERKSEPDAFKEETPIPAPTAPLISKAKKSRILTPVATEKTEVAGAIAAPPESVKAAENLARGKRSAEMPVENIPRRTVIALVGLAILAAALFGIWTYFIRQQETESNRAAPTSVESVVPLEQTVNNSSPSNFTASPAPTAEEIESVPLPRTVSQPPNTVYFQNSKDNLPRDAAKNFLGFSLYYPQNWTRKEAKNNFLDVSNDDEKGLPIEHLLVSHYDSKGTFRLDKVNFAKLVEKSNNDLKKALEGNYKIISQGATKIQNGRWQAYEVKFESLGTAANGDKVTLWGRRLWIPAQITGMKNGYVITMLATSLSKNVKSVEDVGVKGELSNILETFEPNQSL
ncbi:MAG: serine/threonine protein kinase [Pyrinomonadaceae bacterium]|nr:serine/threonine protein kinase [Pyrinomonadaceae bacterium]